MREGIKRIEKIIWSFVNENKIIFTVADSFFYVAGLLCILLGFMSCNIASPVQYATMPTGQEFDAELGRLLKAENLSENPEFFEVSYSFTDINNPPHNTALFIVEIGIKGTPRTMKGKVFFDGQGNLLGTKLK